MGFSINKYIVTIVYITHFGLTYFVGLFEDEITAAKAYDKAAKKLHGKFAILNFKK